MEAMDAGTQRVAAGNLSWRPRRARPCASLTVARQTAAEMDEIARKAGLVKRSAARAVQTFNDVAALTEENTAASVEMAAGVGQVTESVNLIAWVSEENAAVSQQVSAAVEELTATSEQVASLARSLADTRGNCRARSNGSRCDPTV